MSQSQVLETSLSTRTHCSSSEQEGGHPVKSRIPRIWFVFNWRKGPDPTCKWKNHVFQNFRTCSTGAKLKILGTGLQLFWLAVRKSPQWLATRREAPLREAEGSTGKTGAVGWPETADMDRRSIMDHGIMAPCTSRSFPYITCRYL